MPEDFYAALMMRRALPTTTNIKTITAPGIYPVEAGNTTAPDSAAGALLVFLPTSKPKLRFIKVNDWNTYSLVDGSWKGLGTAAIKDIVTSKTDATAERVLTTGWMSLGGYGTDNLIAAADARKPLRNGFYAVSSEPTYGNSSLISFGYDTGSQVHIIAKQGGQAPLLGVCGSTPQGAFGNWGKIYTEFQKPTAGDVGALPVGGGRLTGVLEIYSGAPIIQLTESDTGKKYFLVADGSGFRINEDSTAGNAVLSYAAASKQLKTVGQFVPGEFANFDARYYTKTAADATFQPKGNYTPAGQAYTKAESDARYNLKNTATKAANAMTSKDATTGVMEVVMSNITVAANTNVSVTFSTAFPSVCVGVVITYDGATKGNDSDSSIAVASYTRTGCVLRANNASGKFMLIAKGY